ncbi:MULTISPECIES: hypothetical protein [Micromonospora]|uniref:hypothetical protein n=1 Tax=Micromonospora TaxID=1873 RepID=UPI001128CBE1|nr:MULTISPECIES: hypothetical protein [Micromonospora]MBC8989198.1 hypothetical protein [Micromonospora chalcea]MCK1807600.1 hypothetical protein [Micromonospora sp. R42106]MCK1832265.1 hypothetical protein [Micromonospora sp. R42003]MCK1843636.1 hypothetical protein [Micromonospora sp. R42004]MCM1018154.1 hypothetical protein [Micromonospora sp. XM-20-01]
MAEVPAEVIRQLYATPPDRFVAARDAAVAQARQSGDPRTAREIAKLRRPTVAAWLVNLLAIRRPELVADLSQLAESLRAAQRDLRGGTLRELSAQRRAVVGALVAEVRRLAATEPAAPPAGRLPLGEVEATLNAALSDTEVAEQVRAGRLLRASHYAGFGEVPRPQLRLVTGGEEAPVVPDRSAERADARRARDERAARAERAGRRRTATRELTRARTDLDRAEKELAAADAAERDGAATLDRIETELAELERRRAVAEQELSRARLARRGAERAVTAARRRAGEVEAVLEALDAEEGDADTGDDRAD